jgi:SAM-dependent methyltransferase
VTVADPWTGAAAYERFMGRWSAAVAERFLSWLAAEPGGRWLDVGCGTGALAAQIVARAAPAEVVGVDPSSAFVEAAAARLGSDTARFLVADAQSIPLGDEEFDAAVSGLVLNFVPDPERAVAEMRRTVRSGGLVAAYVWDYADGMEFLREFWDAAASLDPGAAQLDEGRRFEITGRDGVAEVFAANSLEAIGVTGITIQTTFANFDDFWSPFLGGQGPAASYVASLSAESRDRLRDELERSLPREPDGTIALSARAWATRGER